MKTLGNFFILICIVGGFFAGINISFGSGLLGIVIGACVGGGLVRIGIPSPEQEAKSKIRQEKRRVKKSGLTRQLLSEIDSDAKRVYIDRHGMFFSKGPIGHYSTSIYYKDTLKDESFRNDVNSKIKENQGKMIIFKSLGYHDLEQIESCKVIADLIKEKLGQDYKIYPITEYAFQGSSTRNYTSTQSSDGRIHTSAVDYDVPDEIIAYAINKLEPEPTVVLKSW